MRNYTQRMLEQLSGLINNFDEHKISNWLNQAAKQFDATIQETPKEGLIMQFNKNECKHSA